MAQTTCVIPPAEDRARLAAIIGDRRLLLKHVQRARIVLLSADRPSVAEVARRVGVSRPAVWRWQQRYAEQGVNGLLRDKTRPPGRAPLPAATVAGVLALTCFRAAGGSDPLDRPRRGQGGLRAPCVVGREKNAQKGKTMDVEIDSTAQPS